MYGYMKGVLDDGFVDPKNKTIFFSIYTNRHSLLTVSLVLITTSKNVRHGQIGCNLTRVNVVDNPITNERE